MSAAPTQTTTTGGAPSAARGGPLAGESTLAGGEAEAARCWDGAWVSDRLGVSLESVGSLVGLRIEQLVGMAVRRNPRRAHLLVSTVLGKHVPTDPRIVYGSGRLLGELTHDLLDGRPRSERTAGRLLGMALDGDATAAAALLTRTDQQSSSRPAAGARYSSPPSGGGAAGGPVAVLGFAETATALGHAVADTLGAPYLHSTRRHVPGLSPLTGFEEEHSHASSHLLLPESESLLTDADTVVLVDDELSTGTTALNTIRALHAPRPRQRYVIASLVDLRSEQDHQRMRAVAAHLKTRIEVVALAAGRVHLPEDVLARGKALVDELTVPRAGHMREAAPEAERLGRVHRMPPLWPATAKDGARHGFTPQDGAAVEHAAAAVRDAICDHLGGSRQRLHVLAFEELMYAPLRIACHVAQTHVVTYSSTTRSPVLPVPMAAYAIRSSCTFPAHDQPSDGPGPRFAYNVPVDADAIVLVVDDHADTPQLHAPGGLVDHLTRAAPEVLVVTLPSYRPAGVAGHPHPGQPQQAGRVDRTPPSYAPVGQDGAVR